MWLRNRIEPSPRIVTICRIAGILIFGLAFFLPACRVDSDTAFRGWECARMAFSAMSEFFKKSDDDIPHFVNLLIVLSGWINLLILPYFALSFSRRFTRMRGILAIAILVCMVATWIVFIDLQIIPLIGHFLWIAGALLILAGGIPSTAKPGVGQGSSVQSNALHLG